MTERVLGPTGGARRKRILLFGPLLTLALFVGVFISASSVIAAIPANCTTLDTLDNSIFEIDAIVPPPADAKKNALPTGGANLTRDDADCTDWIPVSEIRRADSPSGSGDESFGQGTAENDAVPTIVSGSIPPNKSDLKTFGVYKENGLANKTFVAVFWSRINSPQGTTNMDFEFNKKQCGGTVANPTPNVGGCSSNGVTPARSLGDKLLLYDLSSGGTNVNIHVRTWDGSSWSSEQTLTSASALGSINYDSISAANADGLGSLDPLTFGEAVIDFNVLLGGATCGSFGSVYLKSRSSDSFTSEIKDFVPPQGVNLSNCTTITTSATASASVGGTISDTATLANASSPTGQVSFDLYKFAAGSDPANDVCDAAHKVNVTLSTSTWTAGATTGTYTATVTYPTSGTLGAADIGRYRWIATFAGDPNNVGAGPTACLDTAETSTVSKLPSTIGTAQRFYPNDTATITGTGTFNGTVTFALFHSADCGIAGSDTAVYTKSGVALSGTASGSTAGTDNSASSTPTYAINASNNSGSYSWKVTYSGDSTHNDVTSCVETSSVTITNGSTVTSS
jgi:hypothetical protein